MGERMRLIQRGAVLLATALILVGCSSTEAAGGPLPAEMVPSVESLRIPAEGSPEDAARAVVQRMTDWINTGASAEVHEYYDGSVSIGAFSHQVVAQLHSSYNEATFSDRLVGSTDTQNREFLRKWAELSASNLTLHYSTLDSADNRSNEEPYRMGYQFQDLLGSEKDGTGLNLLIRAHFVHNGDRNIVGPKYGPTRQPVEMHVFLVGEDYWQIDYYEETPAP